MVNRLVLLIGFIAFVSCQSSNSNEEKIEQHLFFGGTIYSFEDSIHHYTAMLVQQGRVQSLFTDSQNWVEAFPNAKLHDLHGQVIYPGFHDAHAHFYGYGKGLTELNLKESKSWKEGLTRLKSYALEHPNDAWLIGRGWDQNIWPDKEFPTNSELNTLFPDRPVLLTRIDGHACIVNEAAIQAAGFDINSEIPGGEIIRNESGEATGVLIDNACDFIKAKVPASSSEQIQSALLRAQEQCLANGITAVTDPGLSLTVVANTDSLLRQHKLKMRFSFMLNPEEEELKYAEAHGKIKSERLNVRMFKVYMDGAMGSRGALLKSPYCDAPKKYGLMLTSAQNLKALLKRVNAIGFQASTHCIGDSANATVLRAYAEQLANQKDQRWRIEHAQIMDTADIHYYSDFGIIPSVQPTHATSDFPWVVDRLCDHRLVGAYAYRKLLEASGVLPLGTDVPVESVNPFYTYVSSIYQKNSRGEGFVKLNPSESLSHLETLKGMTYWPAYAAFLEQEYGSLQVGMFADFILLEKSLDSYSPEELLNQNPVQETWINGERVWKRTTK